MAGVAALILTTLALGRLRTAAPSIDRASVWMDEVKRGPMLREVKGPGRLVPENIRWITAETAGRVEKINVRPGAEVTEDTELLVLTNPDVQLQALEAERQLASAEAEYVQLRAQVATEKLTQEATLATLQAEANDARRRAEFNEGLAKKEYIAEVDAKQSRERALELAARLKIEQRRLEVVSNSAVSQLQSMQVQLERLRAVAEFRRQQVASMKVKAGSNGTVSELPLQLGQWVVPGTLLARVVQPDRLKAELRISETQAKDLAPGQRAQIDTRNGIVPGTVSRIAPAASQGTVLVEVALEGPLPRGARPDLNVEGTIEIERLDDVLFTGRPAGAQPEATVELYRLVEGEDEAERVKVRLGRSSVNTIEVLDGLEEGDRVILSDMSSWNNPERVRLK